MALKPRVYPLGRIAMNCIGGYPSSRHTDVDKAAIIMPDRIDPGPKRWDSGVGPVAEQVSRTESEVVYCSVGEDHRPATKLRPLG